MRVQVGRSGDHLEALPRALCLASQISSMDEIWPRGAGSTHNEPHAAAQRCQPTPAVGLGCLGTGGSLRRPPRSLATCARPREINLVHGRSLWPWRHPQLVGSTGPHRIRAPPSAEHARPLRWRVRAIGVSLRCPCRMVTAFTQLAVNTGSALGRRLRRRATTQTQRASNGALRGWHVRTGVDECGRLRTIADKT